MKTKKKHIARRLQASADEPIMLVTVWCFDGLCKGEVFQATADAKILRVVTPQDHFYKMAAYGITDKLTSKGERVAIFLRGLPR